MGVLTAAALLLLGVGLLMFRNQQGDSSPEMRAYRIWKPRPPLPTRVPPASKTAMMDRLMGFAIGQVLILIGLVLLVLVSFVLTAGGLLMAWSAIASTLR